MLLLRIMYDTGVFAKKKTIPALMKEAAFQSGNNCMQLLPVLFPGQIIVTAGKGYNQPRFPLIDTEGPALLRQPEQLLRSLLGHVQAYVKKGQQQGKLQQYNKKKAAGSAQNIQSFRKPLAFNIDPRISYYT